MRQLAPFFKAGLVATSLVAATVLAATACQPSLDLSLLQDVPKAEIEHLPGSVQDHYTATLGLYQEAIEASTVDAHLVAERAGELGKVANVYKFWPTAEAAYHNAVAADPDSFEWNYLFANLLSYRGRAQEALDHLLAVRRQRPDFMPMRISILEAHFDLGDLEAAEKEAEAALQLEPKSAPMHFLLGQIHLSQARWPDAIEHLERCLELDPFATSAHHGLAAANTAQGNLEVAKEHRDKAGGGRPKIEDPILGSLGSVTHNDRQYQLWAQDALRAGNNEAAIALLLQAKEFAPEAYHLNLALAVALNTIGQHDRARITINEYLAGDLGDTGRGIGLLNLGLVEARAGRPDRAIEHYQDALQIFPEVPNGHLNLGTLLCKTEATQAGLEHLRQAHQESPDNASIVLHLAKCRLDHSGPGDALEVINEAIESSAMPVGNHATLRLAGLRILVNRPAFNQTEAVAALEIAEGWFDRTARVEFIEVAAHALARLARRDEATLKLRAALQAAISSKREDLTQRFEATLNALATGEPLPAIPLIGT